jgi:hypothetical protein
LLQLRGRGMRNIQRIFFQPTKVIEKWGDIDIL